MRNKIIGRDAEWVIEDIENGNIKLEEVIKARNEIFQVIGQINPESKAFVQSSQEEKKLFFNWCELNRVIGSFEETISSISETDELDNFQVDEL